MGDVNRNDGEEEMDPNQSRRSFMQAMGLASVAGPSALLGESPLRDWSASESVDVKTSNGTIIVVIPTSNNGPGYEVHLSRTAGSLKIVRDGTTVLATPAGGLLRFHLNGTAHEATKIQSYDWDENHLSLQVSTTASGVTATYRLTPKPDRYHTTTAFNSVTPAKIGTAYRINSAGHWYGNGEKSNPAQPWPLEDGGIQNNSFGPASYHMIDPFWFTSSGIGTVVTTQKLMNVDISANDDGLAQLAVKNANTFEATTFVEKTARDVYDDYIEIAGTPNKVDANEADFELPLWNTWGQFYRGVTQEDIVDYTDGLAENDIPGTAIQIDDRWQSDYGDLSFDLEKFPDPKAMSDHIHDLGYNLGIWVTFWINTTSKNFDDAAENGYLLTEKNSTDPCIVSWWNGKAGILDLANPDAREWYKSKLDNLMNTYNIDGLKFDTRFFDDHCAPREGYKPNDYLDLGAEFCDQYDMQGVGVRISWTDSQQYGFTTRTVDKSTDFNALQVAIRQNLAVSSIGYPFIETDMIGGSSYGSPPTKQVLIRWVQAAALMPLMYSSTTPVGMPNPAGPNRTYDQETIDLYREAITLHRQLTSYILDRTDDAVETGEPIMKPLFFNFPNEDKAYTIDDQWMLGDAILAAPVLKDVEARNVYLPEGRWYDVNLDTTHNGNQTLEDYPAPLKNIPLFVRLDNPQTTQAQKALKDYGEKPPTSVLTEIVGDDVFSGEKSKIRTIFENWDNSSAHNVSLSFDVPGEWTINNKTQTSFQTVQSGEKVSTTWTVTPPKDSNSDSYTLTGQASYDREGQTYTVKDEAVVTLDSLFTTLTAAYNNNGISADNNSGPGNFDGDGNSFSAQALADAGLASGSVVTYNGVDFSWPGEPFDDEDNVQTSGEKIKINESGSKFGFLGSGLGSGPSGDVTVVYSDGTQDTHSISFPNWTIGPGHGAEIVAASDYRNTPNGPANFAYTYYVYFQDIPVQPQKTIEYIKLPNKSSMHIFSIGLSGMTTTPLSPIGDSQNVPTDPDSDGLYEDIDGDSKVTDADGKLFFEHIDDPEMQDNVEAFDFNENGRLDFDDIVEWRKGKDS